jgi:hypothetical protein
MPQVTLTVESEGNGNNSYGSFKSNGQYWSYARKDVSPQVGKTYTFEYEDKVVNGKTFHNISREIPQPQGQPPSQGGGAGGYGLKDRVIARIAIAKSCIEAGDLSLADAQRWLDWVEGRTKIEPARAAARRVEYDQRPSDNDNDYPMDDEIPF